MKNRIIFFSGGLSSFAVADYVKAHHPEDNVVLYFTDTMWEDVDLYRFIEEVSDKLQLPMLTHSRGITPPQLMVQQRFMANSRVGTCSKELKMKVAADFIKKGIVPEVEKWRNANFLKNENFTEEPMLYFGIDFTEAHRENPIKFNWRPYEVQMPLIENAIDYNQVLAKWKIKIPKMYLQSFQHNNCAGRCVKGGMAHFKNLLLKEEARYMELMEQEIIISDYIRYCKQPAIKSGKQPDYMFKDVWEFVSTGHKSDKIKHLLDTSDYRKNYLFGVDSKGRPIKKPYTFMKTMSLEELEQQPAQCDMFDIGGCGCFVEYEDAV